MTKPLVFTLPRPLDEDRIVLRIGGVEHVISDEVARAYLGGLATALGRKASADLAVGDTVAFQHRDTVLVGLVIGADTALDVLTPNPAVTINTPQGPYRRGHDVMNWRVLREWCIHMPTPRAEDFT